MWSWVFMWILRWSLRENAASQLLHLYRLSPIIKAEKKEKSNMLKKHDSNMVIMLISSSSSYNPKFLTRTKLYIMSAEGATKKHEIDGNDDHIRSIAKILGLRFNWSNLRFKKATKLMEDSFLKSRDVKIMIARWSWFENGYRIQTDVKWVSKD